DDLDNVPRQHEHQRGEHRQVGGGEAVEDEFAEEVRREARGAADREQRREDDDQRDDADENQPRIVAERPARRRRRRSGPGLPSRLDRRDGRWRHYRTPPGSNRAIRVLTPSGSTAP